MSNREDRQYRLVQPEENRHEQEVNEAAIEQRHEYAKVALAIDEYLEHHVDNIPLLPGEKFRAEVERVFSLIRADVVSLMDNAATPWPEDMKEKYLTYTQTYIGSVVRAKRVEESFDRGDSPLALSVHEKDDPEAYGENLFAYRIGHPPRGRVLLQRREGYFLWLFYDRQDMKEANGTDYGGSIEKEFVYGENNERQLGSVIIAPADSSNPGGEESIKRHERQHWLNDDVFANFAEIETTDGNENISDSGIKDELIAYIRQGADGERIYAALQDPEYAHLFLEENPSVSYTTSLHKEGKQGEYLADLCRMIDVYSSIVKDQNGRDTLAHFLVGVPFKKILTYLRTLCLAENRKKDYADSTLVSEKSR